MRANVEVEVHLRYDGRWVRGFEMADERGEGPDRQVWLRRRSDGTLLPRPVPGADVRPIGPVPPVTVPRAG